MKFSLTHLQNIISMHCDGVKTKLTPSLRIKEFEPLLMFSGTALFVISTSVFCLFKLKMIPPYLELRWTRFWHLQLYVISCYKHSAMEYRSTIYSDNGVVHFLFSFIAKYSSPSVHIFPRLGKSFLRNNFPCQMIHFKLCLKLSR